MIISTKIRYGLRALVEIAKVSDGEGLLQKEIAKAQTISNKYLDHIIREMKEAKLICNRKSKKSGYILCRKPSEITVYDVFCAFEKELLLVECLDCEKSVCPKMNECPTRSVWKEMNNTMIGYMQKITLQEILENEKSLYDHRLC